MGLGGVARNAARSTPPSGLHSVHSVGFGRYELFPRGHAAPGRGQREREGADDRHSGSRNGGKRVAQRLAGPSATAEHGVRGLREAGTAKAGAPKMCPLPLTATSASVPYDDSNAWGARC